MKSPAWTDEQVYFDEVEYFDALTLAISEARRTVELEAYIFERDHAGSRMVRELIAASARGVRVRILLDGVGSWFSMDRLKSDFKGARVELRFFHPFNVFGFAFRQFNKRLHRKICIVDRKISFVGSFNICASGNRDTAVRLEGPPVEDLLATFEQTWNPDRARWKDRNIHRFPRWVLSNDSKRLRRRRNQELIRRLRQAKSRVWITNAYFVPPFFLLREMCEAALRGVEVKLLLPARPDHAFMKWMAHAFYRILLLSNVRIFEYRPSFLHAKTVVIDDWISVGSTNLNHRSLVHDLEMDVVLASEAARKRIESGFESDLQASIELDARRFKPGPGSRLIQTILLWFRFYA